LEDNTIPEIPVKRKLINKKLILIIIIDILFIIGVVFTAIKLWPSKEKTDKEEAGSIFSSLNIPKHLLQNISKTCDISGISTDSKINCGVKLLTINGYLIEAKDLCEKIEDGEAGLAWKTVCLALVVAQTNQSEGIEMCNEINYLNSSIPKNICLLRIHSFAGYDPFEFCNKINDTDEKYGCTAVIFVIQNNLDEAFKSCNNIKNIDEKNMCIRIIGRFSLPSN